MHNKGVATLTDQEISVINRQEMSRANPKPSIKFQTGKPKTS